MTAATETETETQDTARYADRIRKLLDQAESARKIGEDIEADKFMGRAQALMQQYEISEQMIATARGASAEVQDTIVEIRIKQTGIFQKERRKITAAIAGASTVRVFWGDTKAQKAWTATYSGKKYDAVPKSADLEIIGFSRDLERLQMLDVSLQLQAASALKRWEKEALDEDLPGWHKFKERRTFLESFAAGLASKLREANRQGREDFVKERATETHTAQSEVRTGMELAVRSRKESVNDWVDSRYGKVTGTYRGNRGGGGGSGSSSMAGYDAGRSASVGQGTVGGGRRAIGS